MGLLDKLKPAEPTSSESFYITGTSYWTKEIHDILKGRLDVVCRAKISYNVSGYSKYIIMVGNRRVGYMPRAGERFYEANVKRILRTEVHFYMDDDLTKFEPTLTFFLK